MHRLARIAVIMTAFLVASCRIDNPAEIAAQATKVVSAGAETKVTKSSAEAPSLMGETAIADNFDVAAGLVAADEVPPISPDQVGAFRFLCGAGQLSYDDPIVYPGQPGASHLHQFFGNTGTDAHSTYQSLRTTGGTTCGDSATPVQRSAYWIPAMLDGVGNAVKPDFMLTYYKALPSSHPACGAPDATHVGICIGLPNGLRFIFGYDMKSGKGGPTDANSWDYWAFAFECTDALSSPYTGRYRTIAEVVNDGRCPLGGYLRVAASIPQCWDGKNLDSADHRSHMAWPDGPGVDSAGKRSCPATHPYVIPELASQFFFKVDANFLAGKWRLSSDEMHDSVPGTTMHMDYWEAWSPTIKATWQANCIDRHLSCNNGNLGNGQQIARMQTPPGGWPVGVKVPLSSITTSQPAPAPLTQTCSDGSVILSTQTCPATTTSTKTCSDGSVILSTQTCPAPTTSTQTCPDGSVILSTQTCPTLKFATKLCPDGSVIRATKSCPVDRPKPVRRK